MRSTGSGWGVTTMGLILAAAGAYGMWSGWDMVQLERGWSMVISGAVAVSGGVVTMALGRVIAHLGRIPSGAAMRPEPASAPPVQEIAPRTEARAPATPAQREPEPTEVDRYNNGDEVYVMFSDGSVEVRGPGAFERYPSLAALRAQAEARKR